jgi:hypothetical protein
VLRASLNGVTEDLQLILTKGPEMVHQAATIVGKVGPFLPFVLSIVEDPALPQIITKVKTLKALHDKSTPSTPSSAASGPPKGIDLKRALPILDAAIWYEKHKWAPFAIGASVVLALIGVGRLTKR